MTSRTFASWVEPIAAKFRDDRDEVIRFTRSTPAEAWNRPSPLAGWTYKDLLGHLASNDDIRYIVRSVIAGERVDASRLVPGGATELNARNVAERRDRTIEELIAELEEMENETQELLSQLNEDHKDARQEGVPMSLGEGLASDALLGHYQEHLAQMRTAVET